MLLPELTIFFNSHTAIKGLSQRLVSHKNGKLKLTTTHMVEVEVTVGCIQAV